ncbi:hypothetical protein TNCV_3142731 [Trichonephila clavipes]|nr:hypothetical protein TNCV_3142731 [Trichonephila clavipes]
MVKLYRLTDSLIDKLAHYYGNAIRCNSTSVKEMRKAIWAVWGHSCSTDDEPRCTGFVLQIQIHGPSEHDLELVVTFFCRDLVGLKICRVDSLKLSCLRSMDDDWVAWLVCRWHSAPKIAEPWSSGVGDTRDGTLSSKLQHHANERALKLNRFNEHQPLYTVGLLRQEARDGERREVFSRASEHEERLDWRELFESPFSERKNDSESTKYGGFRTGDLAPGRSEAPSAIKKAILDPRIKADSEPEKLYVRKPDWRPFHLKTCDTAIPESAKEGGFWDRGNCEGATLHGGFRASELTQTRRGITESESFLHILCIGLFSRVSIYIILCERYETLQRMRLEICRPLC